PPAVHPLSLHDALPISKARTDSGFTRKEIQKSEERIFLPGRKNPVLLKEGHPALRLLQRVRDEAHRFSVKSHRARRKKSAFSQGDRKSTRLNSSHVKIS